MRVRVFKPAALTLLALLTISNTGFAQDVAVNVSTSTDVNVKSNFDDKDFQLSMTNIGKSIQAGVKDIAKNISFSINGVTPKISVNLNQLGDDFDVDIDPKIKVSVNDPSLNDDNHYDAARSEKVKAYNKSYPIDGNDKIKLSNQFGRITVNTWDKHEVKVDIQIKAEANSDDDAQRLLDGVRISDSKTNDLVSFRTEIERFNGNKNRKLEINYTVYMPARTDLSVEDSYGSIVLPTLEGRVQINSSYGSCQAQNLANPANDIEGSYGSLSVANMNGGKLEFSYGSVDIEECNNIKAELSYGSFKLGKLKSAGDFDLAYCGGFKIGEVSGALKKLNIDAAYSGVTVGVPNGNFDFDITTSYGGFNYNDDKVTVTSKTPPDGSKHIGTTRNYKGHVGRGSADTQVKINTSYGGVNFD